MPGGDWGQAVRAGGVLTSGRVHGDTDREAGDSSLARHIRTCTRWDTLWCGRCGRLAAPCAPRSDLIAPSFIGSRGSPVPQCRARPHSRLWVCGGKSQGPCQGGLWGSCPRQTLQL